MSEVKKNPDCAVYKVISHSSADMAWVEVAFLIERGFNFALEANQKRVLKLLKQAADLLYAKSDET